MDTETRTQIVLAAVAATGPEVEGGDWSSSVAQMAARITAMCSERSEVARVIDQVADAKVFPGTVLSVVREKSSTRGLVTLRTRPSEHHPDGTEPVRTERTDTTLGLAMAKRLTALVGHKVMVWVEVEQIPNSTRKSRVVRHVEDLGVDANTEGVRVRAAAAS